MTTEQRNRTRYDIMRDMLALLNEGSVNRTRIMYGANLSYTQLKAYLAELKQDALITETENGITITEAGKQMLGKLEALA